jgi:hypothetical protein
MDLQLFSVSDSDITSRTSYHYMFFFKKNFLLLELHITSAVVVYLPSRKWIHAIQQFREWEGYVNMQLPLYDFTVFLFLLLNL